ncbi:MULTISPECIES: hypothetical protein [Lactococcus]|uniref:hypothetical protein n=1 Tax=Lactococcus TaxID=1357 RepID=UPI00203DE20C|nr:MULTISPECIES: hypothetical protein [Lactococcus]
MAEFKSSTGAASRAVGGFQKISFSPAQAKVNRSTARSMRNGKKLSDNVYKSVAGLNKKMLELAKAIPAYAQKVEADDLKDSQMIMKVLPPNFGSSKSSSIF